MFDNWPGNFSEGLANVILNGKGGFIDKTGKMVIEPRFDNWPGGFSEGLANVYLNGKGGFIDKTGKIVINPKFDQVNKFSEGFARVRLNQKYGFIDKTGKMLEFIPSTIVLFRTDIKDELIDPDEKGDIQKIEALLKKGADINAKDKDGYTMLLAELSNKGRIKIVKLLVSKGADVNARRTKENSTALMISLWKLGEENMAIFKYLLDKGADISARDKYGSTVLHQAISMSDVYWYPERINLLIDRSTDINAQENNGKTLLQFAIEGFADLNNIEHILDKGANINAKDKEGNTSLMNALGKNRFHEDGRPEIAKFLLERSADVHAKNKKGETTLTLAKEGGFKEIEKLILQKTK
jgi:ankyrin repeat protein